MTLSRFFDELTAELGLEAVDISDETRLFYGRNELPGGDRNVAGVLYPNSTEQVRAIVIAANKFGAKLYPISRGESRGLGRRSPVRNDYVVVDLGRRMNRIRHFDEVLCLAEVEPGVTFAQMYEELERRGHRLMLDPISGPSNASLLGNTMDKGGGYTPYCDHFYMSCGWEIVLGDGRILRTGDGACPGAKTRRVSKYGYGPYLDGLFLQSNFGIVTRICVWLMPRPAVIRAFFFLFANDDDLGQIVEVVRPLKLDGVISTLCKVTGDLYGLATEATYPLGRTGGRFPLPDDVRRELQREYGVGAWTVSGAIYGSSEDAVAAQIELVKSAFKVCPSARYLSHDEAAKNPILKTHIDVYSGRPTDHELGVHKWRAGGGVVSFLPSVPMIGSVANELQRLSRGILKTHGFEFISEFICAGRGARALHSLVFNREDPDERGRAGACIRALMGAYNRAGYPVSRASVDFQEEAMMAFDGLPGVCSDLKKALDPNGVLAPGKYGIA